MTLRDLGLGEMDLQDHLRDERVARSKLSALLRAKPDAYLRALRFELFAHDVDLKREALRFGAIQTLADSGAARRADEPEPTVAEVDEARRAILCERPELEFGGVLKEMNVPCETADRVLSQIARARRTGVPLLAAMSRPASAHEVAFDGVAALPEAPHAREGTSHSIREADAARIARRISEQIGITRIAQVGELERFALHVTSAYRASRWSSTVGSGKSETLDGAVIGCVLEEAEKYCQERHEPEKVFHSATGVPFVGSPARSAAGA